MTKYGLCYQGGKSKLADWIIDLFPPSTHFYDLFAGGCSVSHAALLLGKFEHVHANDINDSVKLFEDALYGDLDKYEPERFRTREDFFAEKDANPFVRIVYSFSNNQATYLYGHKIEPYKKVIHEMLYAATPNERRLKFKNVFREMAKLLQERQHDRFRTNYFGKYDDCRPRNGQNITMRLTDLEHYERSNSIRALLTRSTCMGRKNSMIKSELTISIGDYRDVEILPDSVIYLDPPYRYTHKYLHNKDDFDWGGTLRLVRETNVTCVDFGILDARG